MKWQPISTAPKDATDIFLYRAGWQANMAVGYWNRDYDNWRANGNEFVNCTHWMPLPPPPEAET